MVRGTVPRGSLDHLRRQILLRLERSGATQTELAAAVGHTGSWLSMILRGQRGIQLPEIDRIAAFLEVSPSALFEDPDLDPSLLIGAEKNDAASKNRGTTEGAARLQQQREIIARQIQTIDQYARSIDYALSLIEPAVRALERLATVQPARATDRRAAPRRGADRSKRARSRAGGGR
jgi:transcriptional regulator with XRE-family HTH domain